MASTILSNLITHPSSHPHNPSPTLIAPPHLLLRMLLINQNIPIPRLPRFHIDNNLISVLQRPLLDPRLDLLIRRELQHFLDFVGRADGAAADLDAVGDERESVDGGEAAAVGSAGGRSRSQFRVIME